MGSEGPIGGSPHPPPVDLPNGKKDQWFILRLLVWVAVGFITLLILLAGPLHHVTQITNFSYDPPFLIPVLDTAFISLIGFLVTWYAIYIFLKIGFQAVLWLGAGAFTIGFSAFIAGWFTDLSGYNFNITVYFVGVLLGSIFNLVGASTVFWRNLGLTSRQRTALVSVIFGFSVIWVSLVSIGASVGNVPVFFVQGGGVTGLAVIILAVSFSLFILSGAFLLRAYILLKRLFWIYYATGLFWFATGLLITNFVSWEGDLINWLGRLAQFGGYIMFLLAVISIVRESHFKNIPVEQVIAEFSSRSKVNFELLVKAAADAIIAIDGLGRVIMWNPAAEKMFGYPQSEAIGTSFFDLIVNPEQLNKEKDKAEKKGLKDDHPPASTLELSARRKNGEIFLLELTSVPGKLAIGKLPVDTITTLIIRDITERKKTEQLKDDFIGMVSHELRTPLTVIVGALRTLELPGLSESDTRTLLQEAVSSSNTMAGIIENLLELSRSQANRLELHLQYTDIGEVADNVKKKLQSVSQMHHLSIEFPESLPDVKADPLRLERILYNLMENAIKYSPLGGEVKTTIKVQGGDMVFCVSDQGPGISLENQAKLFQSFERLDRTARFGVQGIGLGLKVCRTLVEAHGGHIWVESEPGKGSHFCFTLPMQTPDK